MTPYSMERLDNEDALKKRDILCFYRFKVMDISGIDSTMCSHHEPKFINIQICTYYRFTPFATSVKFASLFILFIERVLKLFSSRIRSLNIAHIEKSY